MDELILDLHKRGLSSRQIAERVGLSRRAVSDRVSGARKKGIGMIKEKLSKFETGYKSSKIDRTVPLDRDRAISKILSTTECYLTGRPINVLNREEWSLDHKHPRSRGGTNSIHNMGVAASLVNRSKQNMTVQEFIDMCHDVLKNNGYVVYKKQL